MRYKAEKERETFDNNNNSAVALATLIGSSISIILNPPITTMIEIAFAGEIIYNILYIIIWKNSRDAE